MDSGFRSRSSQPRAVARRGLVEKVASVGGSAESGARSLMRRSAAARRLAESPGPSDRGKGLLGPVPVGAWLLGGLEAGPWREVMDRWRRGPHRRFSNSSRSAELPIMALGMAA